MENSQQLGAAKLSLQTVENAFPKQRRATAAQEYKIAILAWHAEPLPGTFVCTAHHVLQFSYFTPDSSGPSKFEVARSFSGLGCWQDVSPCVFQTKSPCTW